jgi:hypothetical protein
VNPGSSGRLPDFADSIRVETTRNIRTSFTTLDPFEESVLNRLEDLAHLEQVERNLNERLRIHRQYCARTCAHHPNIEHEFLTQQFTLLEQEQRSLAQAIIQARRIIDLRKQTGSQQ